MIGVVLAFGLGLAVLFIYLYPGRTDDEFRVADRPDRRGGLHRTGHAGAGLPAGHRRAGDLLSTAVVRHRRSRGRGRPRVPVRALGIVFAALVGMVAAQAVQIVGALLVMSLLITPAAAAARVVASPAAAIVASVIFAEVAAVGGIVLSLAPGVPVSVFVATISFLIYLFCWLLGDAGRPPHKLVVRSGHGRGRNGAPADGRPGAGRGTTHCPSAAPTTSTGRRCPRDKSGARASNPVAVSALDGLLLGAEQIEGALSATSMKVWLSVKGMWDWSSGVSDKNCLAIDGPPKTRSTQAPDGPRCAASGSTTASMTPRSAPITPIQAVVALSVRARCRRVLRLLGAELVDLLESQVLRRHSGSARHRVDGCRHHQRQRHAQHLRGPGGRRRVDLPAGSDRAQ